MPRKETTEGDVEFVPSPVLVDVMNSEGEGTPEQLAHFDALNTPPEEAPTPERYRELRPWQRENLTERLNEAAADGWRLAAVVGNQIILEREITLEAFTVSERAD